MKDYLIVWTIDALETTGPTEAAIEAASVWEDPDHIAHYFHVIEHHPAVHQAWQTFIETVRPHLTLVDLDGLAERAA